MPGKKPLRRANNEGSLRHRKDGRWEVRLRIPSESDSRPTQKSYYCSNKQQAVRILRGQEIPYQNLGPNGSSTLKTKQWLNIWLSAKRVAVKKTTYSNYQRVVEHQLVGLSGCPLYALTLTDIQSFYDYMLQNDVSAAGLYRIHKVLNQSLKEAVRKGILLTNPAMGAELPPRPTHEAVVFSLQQQRQLIAASYNTPYGICVRLSLTTGLRIGELLALRWQDIDLPKKMLYVRFTQSGSDMKRSIPKTPTSNRSIPLTRAMVDDLEEWKNTRMPIGLHNSVFADENGTPLNGGKIRRIYEKLLSNCKLPHYTFHTLRHTFATRALEVGMDFKTLSVLLGHSSVAFTMDVYTHCSDEHRKNAMKRMDYETPETQNIFCNDHDESCLQRLKTCPEIMSMEQFRKVCHISKRKARELLELGIVPCKMTGKRTWKYRIRKRDVRRYLSERSKI